MFGFIHSHLIPKSREDKSGDFGEFITMEKMASNNKK